MAMTSKKDLKKHINRVTAEIARGVLPEAVLSGIITEEQAAEALTKLAELSSAAMSHISISFDKAPSSFDSKSAYNKAHTAYFHTAYAAALDAYEKGVNDLLVSLRPAKA